MIQPLTIKQAEQRLSAAWGHPVHIRHDQFGYYTQNGDGPFPFYEQFGLNDPSQPHVTRLTPMIGDWPEIDLMDAGIPAQNDAADAAQLWNEQRGA